LKFLLSNQIKKKLIPERGKPIKNKGLEASPATEPEPFFVEISYIGVEEIVYELQR
jgi:hypothetical protein